MASPGRRVAARLGPVGVWSFALETLPAVKEREVAQEIEAMGWPAVWIPESIGSKEAMSHAALLLGATADLVVATGIASIWARDAMAMANGGRTLEDAFPGRVVLGIGVSHRPSVKRRGSRYERPYTRMVEYLDAMESARYSVRGAASPPVVLAALGTRMLRLAAERTAGAHPYFVPMEHTKLARERLGPDPVLAVEQAVVLETDHEKARHIARDYMSGYLELENYARNLVRLGWREEELSGGGSDALVDAVIAWGKVDDIERRVRDHLDAGADHVCVQVLRGDDTDSALRQLRELAPAMLGLR
jgi:probable F420-dependent oxidoreductase